MPTGKGIVSETQMGCNAYLITISPLKICSQPEDMSTIMHICVYLLIYFEVYFICLHRVYRGQKGY